ncbi:MAG: c-type cytochrome [Gammaproteobacteria bacterium]
MADSHAKMTRTTPMEVVASIVAGLLAPLLAIVLIVMLVLDIRGSQQPDTSGDAAQQAAIERIKPFATLAAVDPTAVVVEKSGQEVYDAACVACHGTGALAAPRFENKADWGSRLGQGYDILVKHAIEGIRNMPPRGGNADLTDTEVARAVAYMANSAGADFKAPEAATPEAAAPAAVVAAKPDPAAGKKIYQNVCAMCHAAGVAGAPKPGDKAAWADRIAQGYPTLYDHALNGIRGMPAKGGNPSLSETDLANAVGYLYTEAGGKL